MKKKRQKPQSLTKAFQESHLEEDKQSLTIEDCNTWKKKERDIIDINQYDAAHNYHYFLFQFSFYFHQFLFQISFYFHQFLFLVSYIISFYFLHYQFLLQVHHQFSISFLVFLVSNYLGFLFQLFLLFLHYKHYLKAHCNYQRGVQYIFSKLFSNFQILL